MDNHQHEKHIDPAQARMNRKCIRQHKVDDQPHHIVHAHVTVCSQHTKNHCKQFKILSSKLQLTVVISLLI